MRIAAHKCKEAVVGYVDLVFEKNAVRVWHGVVIVLLHALIAVGAQGVNVLSITLVLKAKVFIATAVCFRRHDAE